MKVRNSYGDDGLPLLLVNMVGGRAFNLPGVFRSDESIRTMIATTTLHLSHTAVAAATTLHFSPRTHLLLYFCTQTLPALNTTYSQRCILLSGPPASAEYGRLEVWLLAQTQGQFHFPVRTPAPAGEDAWLTM